MLWIHAFVHTWICEYPLNSHNPMYPSWKYMYHFHSCICIYFLFIPLHLCKLINKDILIDVEHTWEWNEIVLLFSLTFSLLVIFSYYVLQQKRKKITFFFFLLLFLFSYLLVIFSKKRKIWHNNLCGSTNCVNIYEDTKFFTILKKKITICCGC